MEITLKQMMLTLSRTKSNLSIMMADVDFFKKYNDTYGHSKGDECLRAVAQELNKAVVRSTDFVARYGGEEFAVVLPGTSEAGARIIADKMLSAVRELKILHEKHDEGIVTISIGVVTGCPTHTKSWEEYLEKADEALYTSKNTGRNRYTFYSMC
jgi:diguanylate cyclase (GGDEF)-like protein